MADQGDQPLPIRSQRQAPNQEPIISPPQTPGILITPAEGSAADEAIVSSDDLLQASHETQDDGALPKVHSEPLKLGANDEMPSDAKTGGQPPAESKTEKPLVSPEDDSFNVSDVILSRPISPVDDEDDDKESVKSSFFTDSDSDEEFRGRRAVSSRDYSPSFAGRVLSQATNGEARFKSRRSQGELGEGFVPTPVIPSPLKFRAITREGNEIHILSPTEGNSIVITDPEVVEELDKSLSEGHKTLSPVATASFSPRTKEFLAKALEEDEIVNAQALEESRIVKLGEAYKNEPKRTPPAIPERPGTPQFDMSTAEAEEEAAIKNANANLKGTARKAAESGTLHRRVSSVNPSGLLVQKRFNLLDEEVKKLRVNPRQVITRWGNDTLWAYMCSQYDRIISITDVLAQSGLTADPQKFSTFRDEKKFFRSEFDRIQSEAERQKIADNQAIEELTIRIQELETEAVETDATIEGLEGAAHQHAAIQAILDSSDNLSTEAQEALDKVEAHAQKYSETYNIASQALKAYRDRSDLLHEQEKKIGQLERDKKDLREQLSESAKKSEKCREEKLRQQQDIEKINKAYMGLQKENAQLNSQAETLNYNRSVSELKQAELEVEIKKVKDINSTLEAKTVSTGSSKVAAVTPVVPEPKITQLKKELKTTQDSNTSLENKNLALEKLLKESREESARYEELYKSADEQRVWSFANYATVKKPWPIVTREIMASLVVDVVTGNSDVPEALTRDQVIVWFAGDMGLSEIFNEIRALGHNLDTNLERIILSVLIEQGLCYGNFDVFAAFAFAGVPVSRDDFVSRMSTIIELLDRIRNKLLSAEVDRDLAKDQARKLELKDRQQQLKLNQQAHALKKARDAMETFEKHNGSPEGAVEDLIVLQTEHADLKFDLEYLQERNDQLADELAYYERELVEMRQSDKTVRISGHNSDEEVCTLVEHRDLAEQIRTLRDQNRELAGTFNKALAGKDISPNTTAVDSLVGETPVDSVRPTHDYYAELLSLREENERLTKQYDNARVQVPDSPACPHCSVLRAQINRLKQTNRSHGEKADLERENAVYAARNSAEAYFEEERQRFQKQVLDLQKLLEEEKHQSQTQGSDSQDHSPTQSGVPLPCQNCGYLTAEKRRLFAENQKLEAQLKYSDSRVHKFSSMADRASQEAADARTEIEALKQDIVALKNGSPDSITSTQPTTAGNTPMKPARDARIQDLEAELAAVKKTLGGTIASEWSARWGATKISIPPFHQQDDAWKTFETEGNYRNLLEERQKLREQNDTMQKNLDDFEAASAAWFVEHNTEISELENAEVKGNQARIDNFQRQIAEMHHLRETNSTLTKEKDYLISKIGSLEDAIDLLEGKDAPDCCGAMRQELQNEIGAHESTKTLLEKAIARQDHDHAGDDDNGSDPCKAIREEYYDAQNRLSEMYQRFQKADKEHHVQLSLMTQEYMDLEKRLKESERRVRLAEGQSGGVSLVDPSKNIREELESTKSQLLTETRRLNARLEQEQTKLKDLNSLFIAAEAKLADLEARGNDSAADDKIEDSQKQIKELMKRISVLESELEVKPPQTSEIGAAQNDLLQKRIVELENALRSKPVHTLTGSTIQLPANDDPCKDTILELISAQTKLNGLIESYQLDTPADNKVLWKSAKAPVQRKKKEQSYIQGLFGVFERFTLQEDASAPSLANTPIKSTREEKPEAEEKILSEDPNDPCSSVKKQLKAVEKQIKAFERITELKIKLRHYRDKIHQNKDQWSRTKMTLKNQVEVFERDTPTYLKKKLNEALEANAKQANIIECAQIVAGQHNKENRALHKKLEILIQSDQPMKDLLTENAKQKGEISKLYGDFQRFAFKKGKEINFLGKQLSVLYGEREKWQGNASSTASANSLWTPLKKSQSSPVKESVPVEIVVEASTESGADPPLPKITNDGWPCPPEEKQKLFDEAARKAEEMYKGTVYVLKDRESHMPEPKITGLFTEVQYPRWKLPQPKKQSLYSYFKRLYHSSWFVPLFWILMIIVDQIDRYMHYGASTLEHIIGPEREPYHWVLPLWITLPALFFIQQIWLLDTVYPELPGCGDDEEDVTDSLPVSSLEDVIAPKEDKTQAKPVTEGPKTKDETLNNEDPCRIVKSELVDTKFKLVDALDQLAGNKTVIDWKNDKKTPIQWRQTVNTKFWECAGVPGPRLNETMTFEEYKKLGDAAFSTQSNGVEAAKQASSSNSKEPLIRFIPETKESPLKFSNVGSVGYEPTAPLVDPVTGRLIDIDSLEPSTHFASQIGDNAPGYPEYSITGPGGISYEQAQPDSLYGAPGFKYSSAYGPGSTISGGPIYDFQSAGNPFDNAPFFVPSGQAFYTGGNYAQALGLDGASDTPPRPVGASGSGQSKTETPRNPDSGYGTGYIPTHLKKSPSQWIEFLEESTKKRTGVNSPTPLSAIRYSRDDPQEVTYADFILKHLFNPKSEEQSAFRGSQACSFTQGSPPLSESRGLRTPPFNQGDSRGIGGIFDPNTPPPPLDRRYRDDFMARLIGGDVCCELDYMEKANLQFIWSPVPTTYGTKLCRHKNIRRTTADAFGSPSMRPARPQQSAKRPEGLGAGLIPEDLAATQKPTSKTGFKGGFWQVKELLGDLNQQTTTKPGYDGGFWQLKGMLDDWNQLQSGQYAHSSNDVDPCKDVKDKLAAVETELRSMQATPDSYEFRCKVKELQDEHRALKILYDPLRSQLTSVEAELNKEKKDHEVAKKKLAMADPAIIKTNEEAEAQRQKNTAEMKAKDTQVKALEKKQEDGLKLREDLRKQLDLARAERPSGSVQTEIIYKTAEGRTWTRTIIQAILATWLSLYFYSWFQELPEGMSSYEVAYFEMKELFEDYEVLIFTCAGLVSAVFITYFAWQGVNEVNPYPDSDVYLTSGPDDKGDDDDDKSNDSSAKDGGPKPDGKSEKSDKDESETRDDSDKKDQSKTDGDSDKKDKSGEKAEPVTKDGAGQKGGSDKDDSAKKDESEKEEKSPKGYGYKNPMSFFSGRSVSSVPEAAQTLQNSAKSYAKNIKSLFIAPSRVIEKTEKKIISPWKHSKITSVNTEPRRTMVSEDTGEKLESGVDVYCKNQEDVIEKLQTQLAAVEKSLAATTQQLDDAKKPSTLSYSNISSVGTSPEAAEVIKPQPSATYASVSVQTDETAVGLEDAKTANVKLEAIKQKIEASKAQPRPSYASVAAQTANLIDASISSNAELQAIKKELEVANAELESVRKDRDELADNNKTIKVELDAVRKDKNDLWNKHDDWNKKSEKDQEWEDPCKSVKEELKRVKDELADANAEIKWLRNEKKREEKRAQKEKAREENTGGSDDDDDDSDSDEYDDDNPPPGSIEMKLYVATDNLRFRDLELANRTRELEKCHELNKALRTRFYDANDELNALKAGNNSSGAIPTTNDIATQTTPSNSFERNTARSVASSASSGGIDHTECNRQIANLNQIRDSMQTNVDNAEAKLASALRQLDATIASSIGSNPRTSRDNRQDYINRLLATIEELEQEKKNLEKQKMKLEKEHEKLIKENRASGMKRLILEDDIGRLEESLEVAQKESDHIEMNLNGFKEEVEHARKAVEKKNQQLIQKDGDIQRFGRQAYDAVEDAKEARQKLADLQGKLFEWIRRDEPNQGYAPENLNKDPHVHLLQRVIFEMKNKHQAVVGHRDDAVKELKFLQSKLAAMAGNDPDHAICRKRIRELEYERNWKKTQNDDATVTNRKLEIKMKEWESLARQVEQEKEELVREFYERSKQAESFEALMDAYAGGEIKLAYGFARMIYEQSKAAETFEEVMDRFFDGSLDLATLKFKTAAKQTEGAVEEKEDTSKKAPQDLVKFSALKSEATTGEIKDTTGKSKESAPWSPVEASPEDLIEFSPAKPEELAKYSARGSKVAFTKTEDAPKQSNTPETPKTSSPVKATDGYPTPEPSEVTSQALKEMKLRLRQAEDEARRLGTDRNRLARENAALKSRLERNINALEHGLELEPDTTAETFYPTPVSTNRTKDTDKTRPSDIITSFENLSPGLMTGALPTGGLKTGNWMTKFDPNYLRTHIRGGPLSTRGPIRGPIPAPHPPFPPFEPLTPEGRRRAAERLIDDPDREKSLMEKRAVMAAYRKQRLVFDEWRSDEYANEYKKLRPQVDIPSQHDLIGEKIEKETENYEKERRRSLISEESLDSSERSLSSGEWDRRYNVTPTPLPRNSRGLMPRERSRSRSF